MQHLGSHAQGLAESGVTFPNKHIRYLKTVSLCVVWPYFGYFSFFNNKYLAKPGYPLEKSGFPPLTNGNI